MTNSVSGDNNEKPFSIGQARHQVGGWTTNGRSEVTYESIMVRDNGDGKIGTSDLDKSHVNESNLKGRAQHYFNLIKNFFKKHKDQAWNDALKEEITKLVNKFNKKSKNIERRDYKDGGGNVLSSVTYGDRDNNGQNVTYTNRYNGTTVTSNARIDNKGKKDITQRNYVHDDGTSFVINYANGKKTEDKTYDKDGYLTSQTTYNTDGSHVTISYVEYTSDPTKVLMSTAKFDANGELVGGVEVSRPIPKDQIPKK